MVYLSPVPWESFSQRPHRFVEWFHQRTGGQVLWIDPYPTRLPNIHDLFFSGGASTPSGQSMPRWIKVVRPRALPIEPLPVFHAFNRGLWGEVLDAVKRFVDRESGIVCVGKPSELACRVLEDLSGVRSLYDAMDDFPSFYGGVSRRSMARREERIANRVDWIFVSSGELQKHFRRQGRKVINVPNACCADSMPDFRADRPVNARPIIGYVGTIGHWFDWPLVSSMAANNPGAVFRVIGPVHQRPPTPLPENVETRPPLSHAKAIAAMAEFDAGIIPFKKNSLTASVDPIKYYEYRALGLPVISTAFGEMATRRDEHGVFLLESGQTHETIVTRALTFHPSEDEVAAFRRDNRWDARFDATGIIAKSST